MSIRAQLIVALAGALLLSGGAWWLRHDGYRQGVSDTKIAAAIEQAAIEQGMQYERDKADAAHRGAVLAREAAQNDAAAVRARLDGLLRKYRNQPAPAGASGGLDGSGPDWIGGFAACYGEYADLGADAARWADQVNGLQGYVRAIRKPSTTR